MKGLDIIDKSIESSSTQTGVKGLDAIDQSIGSSNSQEGNRSLNDKESESWLSNKKALFDESPNELKKWGDLSDEDDNDKSVKGYKVTDNDKDDSTTMEKEDNFNPNDPNLYNLVPMRSSMFDPTHVAEGTNPLSDANDNPGSVPLPTNPFADGRAWSFVSEKEGLKNPNKTQIQESSSVAKPLVNRGEGTEEDKQKWVNFLNGPRTSKPSTPNRDVGSRSPDYDPGSRSGSTESDPNEQEEDQDMVDLTENEGASNNQELPEPFNQEEAEEHFIEALIERNQNGELSTLQEVIQAILDIGGEALANEGMPITFNARIALKLLQRSDPLFIDQKL